MRITGIENPRTGKLNSTTEACFPSASLRRIERLHGFLVHLAARSEDEVGTGPVKAPAEQVLDIGRQTRRQYPAEEKIRTVLEGLRSD